MRSATKKKGRRVVFAGARNPSKSDTGTVWNGRLLRTAGFRKDQPFLLHQKELCSERYICLMKIYESQGNINEDNMKLESKNVQ